MGINFNVLAATTEMNGEFIGAVVLTGLVVVFLGLVLLVVLVEILGSFFKNKTNKQQNEVKIETVVTKTVPVSQPETQPVIEDGISDEVIAVITAAIEAYSSQSGVKLAVKSVRKTNVNSGRAAWANAGLIDNSRPF